MVLLKKLEKAAVSAEVRRAGREMKKAGAKPRPNNSERFK
jgi:hypothetical protein